MVPFVLAAPLNSSLSKAQSCTNRALKQDEDKSVLFCRSAELPGRCIFAPRGCFIAHAQVSAHNNDHQLGVQRHLGLGLQTLGTLCHAIWIRHRSVWL